MTVDLRRRCRRTATPLSTQALVALLSLSAGPLSGQDITAVSPDQMGRLVVRLVDAQTGAPVTQALLTLTRLERRVLSDSTGTAMFLDMPPGSHEIVVRHIGYGEQTLNVDVESMTTAILGAQLTAEALAVAPIEVVVENRPRYLEDQGFYARRVHGLGQFFDPGFVDRWGSAGVWSRADKFVQLLKDMSPPFHTVPGLCVGPVVYVDGIRVFDDDGRLGGRASTALELMSTYTIGAVEVYSDTGGVPDFALDPEAACGVIAMWTNRWRGRTRELGGADVELCQPDEPGTSTVEGTIRDEFTEVLLPGAHVFATIHPIGNTRSVRRYEIVSDKEARYRVCDIPPEYALTLRAATADRTTNEVEVPIDGPIVDHDLAIRVAGPGDVVGRVVDRDSGQPLAVADISFQGQAKRTQTDDLGFFTLDDVHPGDHVVEIAHLGFEPVTRIVSVVADGTVEMRVELSADPIALEPIVITAVRDRRLDRRGFYDRRMWGERTGQGEFMDAATIERRPAASATSLLGDVPGLRVQCSGRDCTIGTTRGSGCRRMNVYVNGTLAIRESRGGNVTLDQLVRPAEIEAIEVYPGGISTPAEFLDTSSRCGAVVIWTR